ncbi:hypothetical protein MG293_017525 [Ovis ammon polii]|uniref:Uncharacterized protein n=1 Tax=Ovis ammon polii TaxID=230172 RepID=A0AAD4TTV6_OVIAM|nr:hypothetical protein MG293_017525 [Ovis ammon polii]KAI4553871.1 hypothetical protein MJT46_016051 [Ovis ammon polii x Ovis aries]
MVNPTLCCLLQYSQDDGIRLGPTLGQTLSVNRDAPDLPVKYISLLVNYGIPTFTSAALEKSPASGQEGQKKKILQAAGSTRHVFRKAFPIGDAILTSGEGPTHVSDCKLAKADTVSPNFEDDSFTSARNIVVMYTGKLFTNFDFTK